MFSLMVLLSFCLIFCQFELGVAYKSVAYITYKKSVYFRQVLDKHTPLKRKRIKGNQAPFMTKEPSQAAMTRSKLKKYVHGRPAETS